MTLITVLHTPLLFDECEKQFERLSRGGLYVWKQITGRGDKDRITLTVGPESLTVSRIEPGRFMLKPFLLGGNSNRYAGRQRRTSFKYQIDLRAEADGTRLYCTPCNRENDGKPDRISKAAGSLMSMIVFGVSLLDILGLVSSAAGGPRRPDQGAEEEGQRTRDDLELFLRETIKAELIGYQAADQP